MNRLLTHQEFDTLLQESSSAYQFWGPVRKSGRGRFSDTDLITYEPLSSATQIVWDQKTFRSAKEILFPINETVLRFEQEKVSEPSSVDNREIVVFCRSCDIHAVSRLDNIFLQNGPAADPYYKRLRDRLHFVLMECAEPFDSCFCVSMGTNKTNNFGAAVRSTESGILLSSCEGLFEQNLSGKGQPVDFDIQFPLRNGTDVTVPDSTDMPQALYDHELWEEYSRRCIACGRCNTSCPTCSCFSVHDIQYDKLNGQSAERRRMWAGCHVDKFSDMAGGMEFRKTNGSRMRFKTFHKMYDYRKRFGLNMCVGCGRCDDVCPEYISFANCINKVSELLQSEGAVHDQ